MRTNLGNCGIVGNGGGAALKGDHLDMEGRREERVMVGIYIDSSPKLSGQTDLTGPVYST